jgi:cytochrome c oxidase subunit 2
MLKTSSATDRKHFIIVGVLVVLSTIAVFFLLLYGLPLPTAASEQAGIIDRMIQWHLLIIAFLFALVVVFMVYAIVVFRRRRGEEGDGEHFEGNTLLEILWTAIPLLLVFIFAFYGIRALNQVTAAKDNELVVKVEGFQWAWSFDYGNGVISQDLMLPLDRPALMEMHTKDVMHGFWVPEFRVKQDLVPGQMTTLRFTPTKTGEYTLGCTVLCGLSHWSMVAKVKVVLPDQFTAWLESEIAKVDTTVATK